MSLISLFFLFMYIGLFTIGGGLVALTLMQQELIGRGLVSPERFFSMVAISESTPGPIGINMATYLGFELYGVWGGILTSFAVVIPSLVIVLIIARYFDRFRSLKSVDAAFYGLKAGTTGMIAVAAWQVLSITVVNTSIIDSASFEISMLKDIVHWPSLGLFIVVYILVNKIDIHPVFCIALGALAGVFFL